ncbi:H/ACA ribonucleoprotein complex subunit CBF5 [Astathelohania contejeani]|uniref:H/ACA ribonucleoprotein complex subunit CBF5 n=1 Tax=Astathelohania contejeani TaxID=164912 RepID=A0ABQ7HWL0_9MICR|nr:H/ACA ribonucleoprotein complex subunit CBF5 [Thelohania contejeani]
MSENNQLENINNILSEVSTPTETLPLLLRNLSQMCTKDTQYTPLASGSIPELRNLSEYLKYGVITLDKPAGPSSHEVVTWIKNILEADKTGHSGTLDPQVSGCLTVCLNRATRLTKSQQSAGKEYVCVIEFHDKTKKHRLEEVVAKLTGTILQRPPLISAVKRTLRLRTIYKIELIEFEKRQALFKVSCEAGTYIRTLCEHIGLLLGVGAHMKELRRIRSGNSHESECVTLHDLMDAMWEYRKTKNEKYIRRVIKPLETLLVEYPKIVIKDSCVNAICYGAQLTIPGILRYDSAINTGNDVVIITTKGEAVALATALMASSEIAIANHGIVAKTKRVIMEIDCYPRSWKMGKDLNILTDDE